MDKIDPNSNKIRTFSGLHVDVFNPDPETIVIEDIAHALGNLCRFGGHSRVFYSVAQHSIVCSRMGNRSNALAKLMHDASEAYLVDLPTPIKKNLADYKKIEDNLMKVIAQKFNFQYPFDDEVHKIDKETLNNEWERLMISRDDELETLFGIGVLTPVGSKNFFIEEFIKINTEIFLLKHNLTK